MHAAAGGVGLLPCHRQAHRRRAVLDDLDRGEGEARPGRRGQRGHTVLARSLRRGGACAHRRLRRRRGVRLGRGVDVRPEPALLATTRGARAFRPIERARAAARSSGAQRARVAVRDAPQPPRLRVDARRAARACRGCAWRRRARRSAVCASIARCLSSVPPTRIGRSRRGRRPGRSSWSRRRPGRYGPPTPSRTSRRRSSRAPRLRRARSPRGGRSSVRRPSPTVASARSGRRRTP